MYILLRLGINIIAILLTAYVVAGIHVRDDGLLPLIVLSILLAFVNFIIRPILIVLTLPISIVTFGIFLLFVNGFGLIIVSWLSGGLIIIDGFGYAILGGILITIITMVLEEVTGLRRRRFDVEIHQNDRQQPPY